MRCLVFLTLAASASAFFRSRRDDGGVQIANCLNKKADDWCQEKISKKGSDWCTKKGAQRKCAKACDACPECVDAKGTEWCAQRVAKDKCTKKGVQKKCYASCFGDECPPPAVETPIPSTPMPTEFTCAEDEWKSGPTSCVKHTICDENTEIEVSPAGPENDRMCGPAGPEHRWDRVQCGRDITGEDSCRRSPEDCLWGPLEDGSQDPWCYHKFSNACAVNGDARQDCGATLTWWQSEGHKKWECEQAGCCWQPTSHGHNRPWCFKKN